MQLEQMTNQIIIGNGICGATAALALLKKNPNGNVIMISEEPFHSYARMLLPDYIAGLIQEEKLFSYPADQFGSIQVFLGKRVEEVRFRENAVVIEGRQKLFYENLLIASGASAWIPEIEGIETEGISPLRDLKQARRIISHASFGKRAVVLGGGLVGLEVTGALVNRGFKVDIIVKSPQILSRVFDERSAQIFEAYLKERGVEVHKNTDVAGIDFIKDTKKVFLDSGEELSCDLVIVAKGVKPNVDFIDRDCIHIDNGIVVNQKMETGTPHIYAAGDVAVAAGFLEETPIYNAIWGAAVHQGIVAATNMAGGNRVYEGNLRANIFEVLGLKASSIGLGGRPDKECKVYCSEEFGCYKKLVFKGGRLVGALLIGDIEDAGILQHLIKKKINLCGAEETCLRNKAKLSNLLRLLI